MILIYHLRNGGAERVASNLCDGLSKKYKVILVTCDPPSEDDYPYNVERIVLNKQRAKYLKYYDTIKQIKDIKRKYNITHTISFTAQMNYLNAMSKVFDQTIISIRNFISLAEKDNLKENKYMNRISIRYADKITVVSKVLKNDLIINHKAKNNKIYPIYNFVDQEKIDNSIKENNNHSNNTIITVGRLTNQKGHLALIHSFQYVVKEIKNAQLIILGQGPLEDKIKEEIKKLHLEKNIKLIGYQKNPYIYMKKSTIFVLSSFYEGMPNVILEAMYCGLPIISTDCKSGPREIIEPNDYLKEETKDISYCEFGILVPILKNSNCEKSMANAIIKLMKDSKLRDIYSKKSQKRVKDFTKKKIMKEWYIVLGE